MADSSILTDILGGYVNGTTEGFPVLREYASSLFNKLLIIEIVLFGIGLALGKIDFKAGIVSKVLLIGFVQFLLFKYTWIIDSVRDGFVQAGLAASGNRMSISQFLDPSAYMSYGFAQISSLVGGKTEVSFWTLMSTPSAVWLLYFLVHIVIFIAYVFMGLQIFLAVVEFYLISSLSIILIPFLVLQKTNFLGTRAINGLLNICLKLMVLAFIASLSAPVLELLSFVNDEPTIKESMSLAVGAIAVALIMWRAPSIAMNMISGGAGGLDVNSSIIQPAMSAINSTAGAAKMAAGAARFGGNAASAIAKSAYEGASYVRSKFGK